MGIWKLIKGTLTEKRKLGYKSAGTHLTTKRAKEISAMLTPEEKKEIVDYQMRKHWD